MSKEIKGKVYDIQPFSVQDGPGIRTTVFLKGCPLRCPWCHSPESQEFPTELCWMETRCIGVEKCGLCIKACPRGCLSEGERVEMPNGEVKHLIRADYSKCIGCGSCARACIPEALYFCGTDYTVDEILEKLLKDKAFFDHSGGGMTLSGGECLCQPEFSRELLRACRENDIHTAVDTTGFADWSVVEAVLPYTELFLYDIKHMDSQVHKAVVGVPNERILDNARRIAVAGGKFQIRIPLIPGFNESVENIEATGDFLRELGNAVESVQLLPYHKLGLVKWKRLSRRPPQFETEVPGDELVQDRKARLEARGLTVMIH